MLVLSPTRFLVADRSVGTEPQARAGWRDRTFWAVPVPADAAAPDEPAGLVSARKAPHAGAVDGNA